MISIFIKHENPIDMFNLQYVFGILFAVQNNSLYITTLEQSEFSFGPLKYTPLFKIFIDP